MALVQWRRRHSRPLHAPPPCLQLGGLPYELAAAILLLLSPVERVLAERTCRGWLALLRSPALWATLDVAAAVADLTTVLGAVLGRDAEQTLPHLVRRAGGALREVDDTHDQLSWAALHAVFDHASPSLEVLRLRAHTSEDLHTAAYILDAARGCRRLRQLDIGSALLDVQDDADDVRAVLTRQLPHGCVTEAVLHAGNLLEADEEGAAPVLLDTVTAFGSRLCACAWARIAIEVPTALDSVDAATVTARLRCFVAALAPACASRVGLRIDALLCAEAARCVTRAAPPCVRFDVWNVECTAADAPLLREALRPGAVLGCTLTLTGLWPAADVQTAMDALRASAVAADAAAGEQLRVSLRTAQAEQAE